MALQHDKSRVDWGSWLHAYRAILGDLRAALGPPGHIFTNRTEVVLDRIDQRKLGEVDKVT